ncbi:hypothetical protein EJ110_NYTH34796 [Nymphaea thermarum]|nr:hypothetical protein EJ110_NYTH34796 [Nymphaea thermarum]
MSSSDKEYCPTPITKSVESYSSTKREAVSKRKKTSKVWIDFTLVKYKGKKQISEGKQRTLSLAVSDFGATSLCIQKFNMETMRKLMSKCLIKHEL